MGRKRRKFEINFPMSWDEISLSKFEDVMRMYDSNEGKASIIDVLGVISDKTKEEIEQMPHEVVTEILKVASYIDTNVLSVEPLDYIELDGNRYRIKHEEELRFKEFVDVQTMIENDRRNYAAILAILCRKEDEVYDDDFIASKFDERLKMFESLKITEVAHLIAFFLRLLIESKMDMRLFSERLKLEASRCLDNIETSLKNGGGKKRFSRSQMKKLSTLREQLNSI